MELGRNLQWGFDASRLIILPHAGYLANAFYSEETHSLQFYSFAREGSNQVFHTSLSHDVVTHEAGHAILDAVRDRYNEAWEVETAAIHEAIGDLTTIFAGLSHDVVLQQAAVDLSQANFVSEIAEHFLGANLALRNLIGRPQPESYWKAKKTPHDKSLQLTRALYAALAEIYQKSIDIKGEKISALKLARRALQRMVVRGLDYLPPADATFSELGTAMLKADYYANKEDRYKFRKVLEAKLVEHNISIGYDLTQDQRNWTNRPQSWPFLTASDAYQFLDGNRKRLALSRYRDYRDFVIKSVHYATTPEQRRRNRGSVTGTTNSVENVVILYEYPVDVELEGSAFGRLEGNWITIRGGGTLVFDVDGSLLHHARKAVTIKRINKVLAYLKTGLASGHMQVLADTLDDDMRQSSIGHSRLLKLSSDRAQLYSNAAARCRFSETAKVSG
jgi:hypothetical protein